MDFCRISRRRLLQGSAALTLGTHRDVAPHGPVSPTANVAAAADPAAVDNPNDPSLEFAANLASTVDWEAAGDMATTLRVHETASDKAVSQMSDGERRELRRLLEHELGRTSD